MYYTIPIILILHLTSPSLYIYIYPYIYLYALQVMRDLGEIPDEKPKWIILDGDLDANWVSTHLFGCVYTYICISIGDMYMTCVFNLSASVVYL